MKSDRLSGRVAIITGAANGIGLATAARLGHEGAAIVAVDLPSTSFSKVVAQAEAAGQRIETVAADVSQPGDWERVVGKTIDVLGHIDILINCAGISGPLGRFEECTVEAFDQVMAVNVRGIFLGMQAVIPSMKVQGGGSIVNISSISGERGNPRIASYVTSKHAVNGLSQCAALDLIEYGIRVNVVSPAPTDTAMMKKVEASAVKRLDLDPETVRQRLSSSLPIGRYGQPSEIAAMIAFLCSDDASFMTGAIVPVDGGALAH